VGPSWGTRSAATGRCCGYRNRRGEIDELLLGPTGLLGGRAASTTTTGTLVEQRLITDRTGRSPSEQLNEPADELQRFLRERGQHVTIGRVVVLAHRRSRLAPGDRRTVHVATSAAGALSVAGDSADRLGPGQRAELESLIRRDHDFHQRTRPPARRR
jgi:hypothetical protein